MVKRLDGELTEIGNSLGSAAHAEGFKSLDDRLKSIEEMVGLVNLANVKIENLKQDFAAESAEVKSLEERLKPLEARLSASQSEADSAARAEEVKSLEERLKIPPPAEDFKSLPERLSQLEARIDKIQSEGRVLPQARRQRRSSGLPTDWTRLAMPSGLDSPRLRIQWTQRDAPTQRSSRLEIA